MGGVIAGGAHDAGSPVGKGRHGVEQVGGVGSAGGVALLGLLVGGAGVGQADHALLAGVGDEVFGAVELGSHVHQTDVAAADLKQTVEHIPVGVDDVFLGLGALFGLVEEGAFHVHATQHSAVALFAKQGTGGLEDVGEDLLAEGHGGAHEAGDALAAQVLAHGQDVLLAAVHAVAEVSAGGAVDVDVHKAGGDVFAGGVDALALQGAGGSHLGDAAVFDLEIGGDEFGVFGEDLTVADDHSKQLLLSWGRADAGGGIKDFCPVRKGAFLAFIIPHGKSNRKINPPIKSVCIHFFRFYTRAPCPL